MWASREQKAESREQRAESREQRAGNLVVVLEEIHLDPLVSTTQIPLFSVDIGPQPWLPVRLWRGVR
jgi:hypothetical protein